MPANTNFLPALLLSIFALAILLVIVFGLIDRERKRRRLFDQLTPSEIARPYPQSVVFPAGIRTPQVEPKTAHLVVRTAYADWLGKFLLPDQEAGQSFLRMGVEKHHQKFQVFSTSFGQALGMLFSVVMAGDDLPAHQRFERLLAFCLSHPAADQADLTSWQSMPDNRTAPRQDADPHAEGWIALALLASQKQWNTSDRFILPTILNSRLPALVAVYESRRQLESMPYLVNSPAFYTVFHQSTANPDWQNLTQSLKDPSIDMLTKKGLGLTGSGEVEESLLALQLLNSGLDALWFGQQAQKDLSGKLLQLARSRVESFDEHAQPDYSLELQGKFGSLAQVACCAPAVMAYGDQALVDQLWLKLTSIETSKFDPIGSSLRLLALMLMARVLWPLSDNWQSEPFETSN
ncbi:MAG: hypothetical protein WBI14_04590 [Anaerolineaceae bacterium]